MAVLAYHPETGHYLGVTQEQLDHHMRASGWVLASEYQADQAAARAAAEDAAPKKTTKSDEGK